MKKRDFNPAIVLGPVDIRRGAMTLDEAALILLDMHEKAPHGEATVYDILFGIKYADDLDLSGLSSNAIAKRAELDVGPMINLGRKLPRYVTLREGVLPEE